MNTGRRQQGGDNRGRLASRMNRDPDLLDDFLAELDQDVYRHAVNWLAANMPDFERHAAMAIRVGRALAAGATLDEIMRADDVEDDEEAR